MLHVNGLFRSKTARERRNFTTYEGQSKITEPYHITIKPSKIDSFLDDIS